MKNVKVLYSDLSGKTRETTYDGFDEVLKEKEGQVIVRSMIDRGKIVYGAYVSYDFRHGKNYVENINGGPAYVGSLYSIVKLTELSPGQERYYSSNKDEVLEIAKSLAGRFHKEEVIKP